MVVRSGPEVTHELIVGIRLRRAPIGRGTQHTRHVRGISTVFDGEECQHLLRQLVRAAESGAAGSRATEREMLVRESPGVRVALRPAYSP